MARALLTLLAGILLAVVLAVAIAGDRDLLAVLGPVLVTIGLGTAVMAAVAWRARIRARAEQLEEDDLPRSSRSTTPTTPTTPPTPPPNRPEHRPTDEDTDRG